MRAITGSTRTIWIMALVAVVSLGAGLGLSKLIVSPADEAAKAAAPEAGPITVPVEKRALANDVVLRGDAIYEDPAEVRIETGDIGGPAVVTGQVPEVGATLNAGSVILEVTGRPVILLAGELPVYRTLRAGVSGPDVTQLKSALRALGIDPGNDTSTYDAATAAAVRELYARVGYPAPSAGEEADAALKGAQEGVRGAEEQVASAQRALSTGGQVSQAEKVGAQGAVNDAQAALNAAKAKRDNAVNAYNACLAAPPDPAAPCTNDAVLDAEVAVVAATSSVNTAVATLNELTAPRDVSDLRASVAAAQRTLTEARATLAQAQEQVITPMPASEVFYLTMTSPRRVDSVSVKRGSMIAGTAVMSVSGATLQIAGTVPTADADLVTEGAAVVITLPDGAEVAGTVQSVGADQAGPDGEAADPTRKRVIVVPGDLTDDQRMMLQGSNVRVEIPVSSTEGEVMAVPLAALTAGPGGEARVEVLDKGETEPRLVTVETGLAAAGFVEVTPVDGTLEVGDQVVVGTNKPEEPADTGSDSGSTDEPTESATTKDEG